MAKGCNDETEVPGEDVPNAPGHEDHDGKVDDHGNHEDLALEGGGLPVDMCYIDMFRGKCGKEGA